MPPIKLIIGLGNPGEEYENTRHNIGFIILDKMAEMFNGRFSINKKFSAMTCETKIDGKKVILAKPQTFMNSSGKSVLAIKNFYRLKPENIIVAHDDKDIPSGEYKIQSNRSSAGHNGVQSIIDCFGTKNFSRLRIGIKPRKDVADTSKFVLGKISKNELATIGPAINEAVARLVILI